MNQIPKKIYWHANTSSGGTLSIMMNANGDFSKVEKERALADALFRCFQFMEKEGYIPFNARLLSSRDIAEQYNHTRQYWEKLLNEGKILYKETSAGRITTDLWVNGYLDNKEEVDNYVRKVKKMLATINESKKTVGTLKCTQCGEENFQFHVNFGSHTNGICRSCNFHIYTVNN